MSLLSLLQPPISVNTPARMTARELRARLSLAAIFGLRLFGMFVILPVFALHAQGEPGRTLTWVGVALGAYGLTGMPAGDPWWIYLAAVGAGIVCALVIFFAGFNVLEAKLPALVSRAAPRDATGSATGVYSSVQFLVTFFGGAVAWSMGDFMPAASPASGT
jgi:hypothetical protein